MLLLDLKHSGKLCEDLIIRGSNDGSKGNDTEAALSPLRARVTAFEGTTARTIGYCLERFSHKKRFGRQLLG